MVENNKLLDNRYIEKSARDFSRCDLNRIEKVDNIIIALIHRQFIFKGLCVASTIIIYILIDILIIILWGK